MWSDGWRARLEAGLKKLQDDGGGGGHGVLIPFGDELRHLWTKKRRGRPERSEAEQKRNSSPNPDSNPNQQNEAKERHNPRYKDGIENSNGTPKKAWWKIQYQICREVSFGLGTFLADFGGPMLPTNYANCDHAVWKGDDWFWCKPKGERKKHGTDHRE